MRLRLKTTSRNRSPHTPQNKWDSSATNHDDSGQVYTEFTCPGSSMTADWKWKSKGSMAEQGCYRSLGPGCSSLYNMAVRSCLFNSWDITAETLEEVPETVGVALWNRLATAQLDSIHLFLAFSSVYPSMVHRKYHAIPRPNFPLPSYLKELTSPNYQWLTHLTLLHITIPRTALIQVSLVSNLAVLTIGPGVLAPDIGVDDSLLRTLSRSASTGAFSMLRALALRDQSHVTARAFEYLTAFPALSIFATESVPGVGLRDNALALARGWKYKTGKDLSDWLVKDGGADGAKWDVISQALFKLGGQFNEMLTAGVEVVDKLPVVHLAVGGYAGDAVMDVAGEEAMRVWYRLRKTAGPVTTSDAVAKELPLPNWSSSDVRMEPKGLLSPLPQGAPQKRALGSVESHVVRKNSKPVLRASKGQDLGDLLLGFGT